MKMAILLVGPPSKMLDGRVDGSIGYPLDSYDCHSNWGAKKQDIFLHMMLPLFVEYRHIPSENGFFSSNL